MSKLKNTLAVINNRSDVAEGNISKLEDSNRKYSKQNRRKKDISQSCWTTLTSQKRERGETEKYT